MPKRKKPPSDPLVHHGTVKAGKPDTWRLPIKEQIKAIQFNGPPEYTMLYSLKEGAETLVGTVVSTEQLNTCRTMMRGSADERAFAKRNHDEKLVEYVSWELEAKDDPPDGYKVFGAIQGE